MTISRTTRRLLAVVTGLVLAVLYAPLALVVVNSFNTSQALTWPPSGFTTEWWQRAAVNPGAHDAIRTSLVVATCATVLALLLGTLLGLAMQRYSFFGKNTVNLLVILPIALPGIVTGIALSNAFSSILGIRLGFFTLVVAHATFCIVTVFNNVQARLRRMGGNLEEASADLGAGMWTTFRLVTLPQLRSALLAGGLLAFALSFDEIIVTTFAAGPGVTTLPVWILTNLFRPGQAPIVNVVAVVMIVVSVAPIWLAQRLSSDPTDTTRAIH
ncbi:ABC transporter permease [Nocardioides panzhihuensis]|uniref:Putative spermidine/putrescine transport system permease protein n=1 Tax=Nocardioides panzhihuensis TaxID=860243 RepID=A0A7Z0DL11_9ACTN|nr:ABC transporter permease [Nocardioides panzhihuensis]NYI77357.1 putative spermidine/putrescine transport system permease protein [Nocardioides panzhihuensis]